MKKNKSNELNTEDWLHIDAIPENNLNLRFQVPAPDLIQSGIGEAWKSQLKEPHKNKVTTPQKLLNHLFLTVVTGV